MEKARHRRTGIVGPQTHGKYTGRKYMQMLDSNRDLGCHLPLSFFFPVFLHNRNGLPPNGKNTKLFFLLKGTFHTDFTHVLPSEESQPNLLPGTSSEVHQAEREPRFLETLSRGLHSSVRPQASHAQRAWLLCPSFPTGALGGNRGLSHQLLGQVRGGRML